MDYQLPAPPAKTGMSIGGKVALVLGIILAVGILVSVYNDVGNDPAYGGGGSGLSGYAGQTVAEEVEVFRVMGVDEDLCLTIELAGRTAARTIWLEVEPQIGSDAFEGAVFDQLTASR